MRIILVVLALAGVACGGSEVVTPNEDEAQRAFPVIASAIGDVFAKAYSKSFPEALVASDAELYDEVTCSDRGNYIASGGVSTDVGEQGVTTVNYLMRNSFIDCANGEWFIDGSVGFTFATTIERTFQRTIQRYIGNAAIGIDIENPAWLRWACPMDLTVSQDRSYTDNTLTTEITGTWCAYDWTPAWTEAYLAAP